MAHWCVRFIGLAGDLAVLGEDDGLLPHHYLGGPRFSCRLSGISSDEVLPSPSFRRDADAGSTTGSDVVDALRWSQGRAKTI